MKRMMVCIFLIWVILCGCQVQSSEVDWGSFTAGETYSYDEKYYAIQETVKVDGYDAVKVSIYDADHSFVYSFQPARAADFWGICWEKDTYNIWVQSADIGVHCYSYVNGEWMVNYSAIRPDYIRSKYDS